MWETLYIVWTKILEGEPTLWAGILGATIGVAGAIIAGWLSGRISGNKAVAAALEGARRAHADNVNRDNAARIARAVAFVQAVQAELEANFIAVAKEIVPAVKSITADKPLEAIFPVTGSYFSVFEASADRLGDIDDREVRKSIIKTYGAARAFLDVIAYNNRLVEARSAANRAVQSSLFPDDGAITDRRFALEALRSYSYGVVRYWREVEVQLDGFWERTNTWLRANGAKENAPPQVIWASSVAAPAVLGAARVDLPASTGAGVGGASSIASPEVQGAPPAKE